MGKLAHLTQTLVQVLESNEIIDEADSVSHRSYSAKTFYRGVSCQ